MNELNEQEDVLIDQDKAVENYLDVLLNEAFDEQNSAERAADNIAGLLGGTSEVDDHEDAITVDDELEHQANIVQETELENLKMPAETIDVAVACNKDSTKDDEVLHQSQFETAVEENTDDLPNIDYRDSSEDPDVVAEAEKMLSYVFPQPIAAEDTPLRKLQDAGVIKITPTLKQASNAKTPNNTPLQLVPEYASDRFTMMAFNVGGLKMLVSVTELRNVKKVEGQLSAIPGKPAWLYQYQKPEGGTGFIAHGGQLCVPDAEPLSLAESQSDKYIVWMLNGQFGVLCDDVQEMMDINKRQVTWRGSNTSRKWCAGTIRSMKAVLLDAKSLWQMIDELF